MKYIFMKYCTFFEYLYCIEVFEFLFIIVIGKMVALFTAHEPDHCPQKWAVQLQKAFRYVILSFNNSRQTVIVVYYDSHSCLKVPYFYGNFGFARQALLMNPVNPLVNPLLTQTNN